MSEKTDDRLTTPHIENVTVGTECKPIIISDVTFDSAVGLTVKDIGPIYLGPEQCHCVPLMLSLEDDPSGISMTMECYADRFEIDGLVATDADALAFLKRLARHWDAALQASGVCDE